jgi:hypothetical protein
VGGYMIARFLFLKKSSLSSCSGQTLFKKTF